MNFVASYEPYIHGNRLNGISTLFCSCQLDLINFTAIILNGWAFFLPLTRSKLETNLENVLSFGSVEYFLGAILSYMDKNSTALAFWLYTMEFHTMILSISKEKNRLLMFYFQLCSRFKF